MQLGTSKNPTYIAISAQTVIKIAAVLFLLSLLLSLKQVILIFLVALVIASAIEPITTRLQRWHIPRAFGVISIYLFAVLVLAFIVYFFIPPVIQEVSHISFDLPAYFQSLNLPGLSEGTNNTVVVSEVLSHLREWLSAFSSGAVSVVSRFFGGAFSLFLIVMLSFYLAVQEKGIENFLRVVTPISKENYAIDLWRRVQQKIGLWFQGQLALMLVVGVLVFIGLSIIGMEFALTLAILAALFEIIPIFGPIFSAVPAVLLGFSVSPSLGFITLGLYMVIQWLENHVIYPVVVNKIVGVPSIVVILALAAGGALAGFFGVILAIPAASVLLELFRDLEKDKETRNNQPEVTA